MADGAAFEPEMRIPLLFLNTSRWVLPLLFCLKNDKISGF